MRFIVFLTLFIGFLNQSYAQKPAFTGKIAVRFEDELSTKSIRTSLRNQPKPLTKKENSILSGIYILENVDHQEYLTLCDSLKHTKGVVYAEPIYYEQLLLVPDDPGAQSDGSQAYLDIIQAYKAWDISQSDSSIVIGIVDTGTDLNHEDLQSKLYENDDPVNGIDDDNNGYVDDFYGYDFADDDSDPQADGNQHGTHVTGIAGAETFNGKGIASVGYNALISPLKIFQTANNFSNNAYEAILYAAENDYDILCLSWGSVGTYSQFNQDIINYAVLENDVVIVAAAGNTNDELAFYPASYDNVLSVSATNNDDSKASFATYHPKVDLVAPGVAIYSTQNNSTYGTDNGTSHAAPQVAGVAALVKTKFPDLSAVQVMERIRTTTDNIYDLVANQPYLGKLGKGRLNAYKSVLNNSVYSIRAFDMEIISSNDFGYYPADTLQFYFPVANYLDPVIEPEFTLSSQSEYVSIIKDQIKTGFLTTMDTAIVGPFLAVIAPETPEESNIELLLSVNERNLYSDQQLFSIVTAQDVFILENDSISLPIFGNGQVRSIIKEPIKWQDNEFSGQLGIAISSDDKISTNLPQNWIQPTYFDDFQTSSTIRERDYTKTLKSTFSAFNDNNSPNPLGIKVDQHAYIIDNSDNLSGMEHTLINTSTDTLYNLNYSIFVNWDLNAVSSDKVFLADSITGIFTSSDQVFGGIRILGEDSVKFTLLNMNEVTQIDELNRTTILSWQSGFEWDSLGFNESINTALMVTAVVDTLYPGQLKKFNFHIGFKDNVQDLLNELNSMSSFTDTLANNPEIVEEFISCDGATVTVDPQNGEQFIFFSDPLGQDTLSISQSIDVGPLMGDSIIYASMLDNGYVESIKGYKIETLQDIADFEVVDTYFIGDEPNNLVTFTDKSLSPVSWYWDFGNGMSATGIQNPSISYNEPGTYTITLEIENVQGCTSTIQKNLSVLERPSMVDFSQVNLCFGEDLEIFNSSYDTLNLYLTQSTEFIYTTDTIISLPNPEVDTVFYISRIQNGIESLRKAILIDIDEKEETFILSQAFDSASANLGLIYFQTPDNNVTLWNFNGEEFTNTDTIIVPFQEENSLHVDWVSQVGCQFTLDSTFTINSSDSISYEPPVVCFGSDEIIEDAGKILGFYADEELTELIKKGASLTIDSIIADTIIYVVNINNIYPTDTLEVQLSPQVYPFEILADPDTLILSESFNASFAIDTLAERINWYLNEIFQGRSESIVLSFPEENTYSIKASVISPAGCDFEDSLQYVVLNEIPLSLELDKGLVFYPNPASTYLNFKNLPSSSEVSIYNTAGKKVLKVEGTPDRVDVGELYNGIYLLKIKNGEEIQSFKMIISK